MRENVSAACVHERVRVYSCVTDRERAEEVDGKKLVMHGQKQTKVKVHLNVW